MERQGFVSLFEFEKFNRMGYVEVFKELPFFLRAQKEFIEHLKSDLPDILICVDSSGFNRPLIKAAHALEIPVFWYIAPMIWVWKKKKHGPFLGKYATHIGTILPFEKEHWLPFTSGVSYVGNPLLEDHNYGAISRDGFDATQNFTLALIPGSRANEIVRILPDMLKVADLLHQKYPHCSIVYSRAEMLKEELFAEVPSYIQPYKGSFDSLLVEANIALVTSGTATLQAALSKLPHCIIYQTSWLNAFIGRLFVRGLRWIGLPNIVADKEIVPEFVQKYKVDEVFNALSTLIEDKGKYDEMVKELSLLQEQFGNEAPSIKVTQKICELVGEPYESH